MRLKTNIRTLRDLQYWVEEDEPFEHLPKFENRAFYFERIGLDYWDYRCYHYYKINPYKKAENIIAKNVGKDYNNSYSYYLKQFPSHYSRRDLDRSWYINFEHERYRSYLPKYYIDDEGLIQEHEYTKLKKEVSVCSDDYKVELVHKVTKHPLYKFDSVYSYKEISINFYSSIFEKHVNRVHKVQDQFLYLHYKHQYKAQLEDFENQVVSGTKTIYTSKNDYRYKRYHGEKLKKSKRRTKRVSIDEKEFRRLLNEKKLKDKEENLIKILSHGFDPITSFTKRKHE